jgi:hypothetical protein
MSKALEEQRKNRAENDKNHIEVTKSVVAVGNVNKRKSDDKLVSGNKKIKKEAVANESSKTVKDSFEEQKMAKKLANKQNKSTKQKHRKMEKAQWQEIVQSMIPEAGNNEELIQNLQRVSNATNFPQKTKWNKLNRPNFMVNNLAIFIFIQSIMIYIMILSDFFDEHAWLHCEPNYNRSTLEYGFNSLEKESRKEEWWKVNSVK